MPSIERDNLAGMIPEPVTREIFQGVVEQSAVLRVGRKLPNMTSKTQTINVLDMLPIAYWVDGDMGFKQTAAQAWEKKKLHAEELAVIIPIPEAVLADTNYDIWAEVKPRIVEAMGRRVDEAILFGTGKPSTWRKGIVQTAAEAGTTVTATSDLFADIMGPGGLIAKVEDNGYLPTRILSAISMRSRLRALTDQVGHPLADRGHHRGPDHPRSRVLAGTAGHGGAARGDAHGLGDSEPGERLPQRPAELQPLRGLRTGRLTAPPQYSTRDGSSSGEEPPSLPRNR